VDLAPYGLLTRIESTCAGLPAFQAAHPDRQPDAVRG
jgi:maleylpyruvate isomerase